MFYVVFKENMCNLQISTFFMATYSLISTVFYTEVNWGNSQLFS